jgi:hypothetical protein
VNKFVVLSGGLVAAGSAALIGAGIALSQPNADSNSSNVVGEQFGQAVQILKSQGIKARFNGSFGGVLPESQCLVYEQKPAKQGPTSVVMLLKLDCSQKAADEIKATGPAGGGGAPTVGSNGFTTVTPTPVMPIPGAPGAGTPPPG